MPEIKTIFPMLLVYPNDGEGAIVGRKFDEIVNLQSPDQRAFSCVRYNARNISDKNNISEKITEAKNNILDAGNINAIRNNNKNTFQEADGIKLDCIVIIDCTNSNDSSLDFWLEYQKSNENEFGNILLICLDLSEDGEQIKNIFNQVSKAEQNDLKILLLSRKLSNNTIINSKNLAYNVAITLHLAYHNGSTDRLFFFNNYQPKTIFSFGCNLLVADVQEFVKLVLPPFKKKLLNRWLFSKADSATKDIELFNSEYLCNKLNPDSNEIDISSLNSKKEAYIKIDDENFYINLISTFKKSIKLNNVTHSEWIELIKEYDGILGTGKIKRLSEKIQENSKKLEIEIKEKIKEKLDNISSQNYAVFSSLNEYLANVDKSLEPIRNTYMPEELNEVDSSNLYISLQKKINIIPALWKTILKTICPALLALYVSYLCVFHWKINFGVWGFILFPVLIIVSIAVAPVAHFKKLWLAERKRNQLLNSLDKKYSAYITGHFYNALNDFVENIDKYIKQYEDKLQQFQNKMEPFSDFEIKNEKKLKQEIKILLENRENDCPSICFLPDEEESVLNFINKNYGNNFEKLIDSDCLKEQNLSEIICFTKLLNDDYEFNKDDFSQKIDAFCYKFMYSNLNSEFGFWDLYGDVEQETNGKVKKVNELFQKMNSSFCFYPQRINKTSRYVFIPIENFPDPNQNEVQYFSGKGQAAGIWFVNQLNN